METLCMLACGIIWRNTADPDAGLELIAALGSPDPELRHIARHMLVVQRDDALVLLEKAVSTGIVTPDVAGPCMGELLRTGRFIACQAGEA
jgi:hypothetical protein